MAYRVVRDYVKHNHYKGKYYQEFDKLLDYIQSERSKLYSQVIAINQEQEEIQELKIQGKKKIWKPLLMMILPFIILYFVDYFLFKEPKSIKIWNFTISKWFLELVHDFINFLLRDLSLPIFSGFIIYYITNVDNDLEKKVQEKIGHYGTIKESTQQRNKLEKRLDFLGNEYDYVNEQLSKFYNTKSYKYLVSSEFEKNEKNNKLLSYLEDSIKHEETSYTGLGSSDGSYVTLNEKNTGFEYNEELELYYNDCLKNFDKYYDEYFSQEYDTLNNDSNKILFRYNNILQKTS